MLDKLKNLHTKENSNLLSEIGLNVFFKVSAIFLGLLTNKWLNDNVDTPVLADYFIVISYNAVVLQFFSFATYISLQKFFTNKEYKADLPSIWTTINVSKVLFYFVSVFFIFLTYQSFTGSAAEDLKAILIIFTGQYLLEIDNHYRSISNVNGKSWKFSLSDLISKLFLVVMLFLVGFLIQYQQTYTYYILLLLAAHIFSLLLDTFFFRKDVSWGKFDFKLFKSIYKNALYLSFSNILLSLYETTDKLFLEYFNYSEEVIIGYSNAYINVFDKFKILISLIIPVTASNIKLRMDINPTMWPKTFLKSSLFVLSVGLFSALAIYLFGPVIIYIIADQYPLAYEALPILALGMIPFTLQIYFGLHLVFLNGEKSDLISHLITFVVAMILYYFLIGQFGLYGAAWSTVAIYSIKACLKLFFYYKLKNAS